MLNRFKRIFMLLAAAFFLLSPANPALGAEKVKFMLDWYPNPGHVPVYLTDYQGYFEQEGLDVQIMVPADPNDPMKLVAAGKIDFAISYQPSVIIARSKNLPIISIGALVQHPLSTILYLKSSGFKTPADFKGKKIGYSIEPLYRVLFEVVAEKAGLKKTEFEQIRVGFNLAPPLLSGKVDGVIGAFRNYEAIQIELEGKEVGIFPLEEYGIPDFYELVFITNQDSIKNRPEIVKAFMKALAKGIDKTVNFPKESLDVFLKVHPNLRDDLNRKSFKVTLPFFKGSPMQTDERWINMQDFMFERGLIEKKSSLRSLIWRP